MTKQEILAIQPEDKEGQAKVNQIIAEFMGLCWHEWEIYKKVLYRKKSDPLLKYVGIPYKEILCSKCNGRFKGKHLKNAPKNPNYCQSLDLIAQVEGKLNGYQIDPYLNYLRVIMHPWNRIALKDACLTFASALEKAKAAALTILEVKK